MFIDLTKVELKAGKGGKGSVHFRREKFEPMGGPDGGDGGRGGHIIFQADSNLHTLQDIRYRRKYIAEDGLPGGGSRKTGRNGKDLIIKVPVGTEVKSTLSNELVIDLIKDGQSFIICRGGKGGGGNARYKTSTNRAPKKAQPGINGEDGRFVIELKILADVGLVGLPNVGKSTLLSKISAAKPKIADYPFTTLEPNLGIVKYGDYNSFVMADVPGLIEGASRGKGLGHKFLKHIERNKILLYLIDSVDQNPFRTYKNLENEVFSYNPDLAIKPTIICRTKADIKNKLSSEWDQFNQPVYAISSLSGLGLKSLIGVLSNLI